MMKALEADGEKLRQLTGEDHGPFDPDVLREALAAEICRAVAELPDRTSPEDRPDMMLVTADELFDILCDRLPLLSQVLHPNQKEQTNEQP
ncbi:MAG: hypothetical protein ACOY3N_09575 [Bradyrhizobium sp.]|uniref:hypothetical protein n=1 Tax=Bradyrhizobium sp. TaxID=376 RepID=UPI003BF40EF1